MYRVLSVYAREILDSRGTPTVEADVAIEYEGQKFEGRAAIPSGASVGLHEAIELRDNESKRYHGKGVQSAINKVNTVISAEIQREFSSQSELDNFLINLDGTENKSNLGANSILSLSLSFARACASARKVELFQHLNSLFQAGTESSMPVPRLNIMNGGRHANWATDIQEFMVVPAKKYSYLEQLRIGSEIFHTLEKLLLQKGLNTNVGNEGGFAPEVRSNLEAFELITTAVTSSGYSLGEDVTLALDVAASEFYDDEKKIYHLKKDNLELTTEQMVDWLVKLQKDLPITSIEDGLSQDDIDGWSRFTDLSGGSIEIVGDDFLVTNVKRVELAIEKKACNSLLVKVNQIGSLTETIAAMEISKKAGWSNIVSHRSGETEDTFISHLAVGSGCGNIKTGAPSRGERTAKYNELIRISEKL